MQDQHVVDRASARATDAVESWGVSDAAGQELSQLPNSFLYRVSSVLATFIYIFYGFCTVYMSGSKVIN